MLFSINLQVKMCSQCPFKGFMEMRTQSLQVRRSLSAICKQQQTETVAANGGWNSPYGLNSRASSVRRPRRDVDTDETLGLFGSACCVFHLGLRSQLHDYVVVTMVEVKLRRLKAPQQKPPASRTLWGPLVADLQPLGGEAGKEMSTLHRFTPTTGDVKI